MKNYKVGALAYCVARGLNPETFVSRGPHPEGFAVNRMWPRWRRIEEMLKDRDAHNAALAAADEAMANAPPGDSPLPQPDQVSG